MRIEKTTLPTFLASALINGDTSGIEDDPQSMRDLEAALAWAAPGEIVSMGEDEWFSWSNDLPTPTGRLGCTVAEYTILYPEGA